jgi:5-dehydro-2-deoxygluconokinase
VSTQLDLVAIGRVSVDLYGQQIGSRLEDVATFAKAVGGCPANVAIGAARLGLKTALITRVGDEPMGRFVREQLAREGVDTRGVGTDPRRLTSLVLLSVRDERSFPLIFYRENCADSALCEEDIDESLLASARAVLVTGTHFSMPAGARAQRKAIELAKANKSRVVLDIDYRPNLWGIGGHDAGESRYARSTTVTAALAPVLPDCDLIVGTEEELHIAAGVESTLAAIRRIRAVSAAVMVCKRGARGCIVFAGGPPTTLEEGTVVPGERVEIYNVLGAGDAFLAGFLHGYLRGAPHEVSARQANACGAFAVSRLMCSTEFPTLPELEHYLARGSGCCALREDPQLNHLHWVTTRCPAPAGVYALEIDGVDGDEMRDQTGHRLDGQGAPRAELRRRIVDAIGQVRVGHEGCCGVVIDGAHGAAALGDALHRGLWVAGTVHRAGSRSLASRLLEWPAGIIVACRFRYAPDDSPEAREAQEQGLLRLAEACRAQRRELLLGIAPAPGSLESQGAEGAAAALARLYEIGIRADWWELEVPPDGPEWERCAAVIGANDEHCRGILMRVRAPLAQAAAILASARGPWVRGFIGGDSILSPAAEAWVTGQASVEATVADVAERFRMLLAAWSAAREPQREGPRSQPAEPQRSTD